MCFLFAGSEYGGYSSDITRTWPINGAFTQPQLVLYELILTVQKELIADLEERQAKTLDELFEMMLSRLGIYLQEAGLIPKTLSGIDLSRAVYRFCPHHVSHYLGMDVHDCGLIPRNIDLAPGMVFTVEPGGLPSSLGPIRLFY